ncbi:hypothetical protein GobsT_11060 [Gemmata obscuriglobus]|nr:hypothetical protein GobsT_11060 [Gemmata obscuriglobus]VTS01391.1 unnamed protein product [Gemmata obscuriglobus UQM 2246]
MEPSTFASTQRHTGSSLARSPETSITSSQPLSPPNNDTERYCWDFVVQEHQPVFLDYIPQEAEPGAAPDLPR